MLNVATLSKRYVHSMEGLVIYVLLQNIILDIKQAFSGYINRHHIGFYKRGLTREFGQKIENFVFFFVGQNRSSIYNVCNILRYSEILGLLGLIRRNCYP